MRPSLPLILAAVSGMAAAADIRILSVEPTVLFPRQEPLRQIAVLNVWNGGSAAVAVEAAVEAAGRGPVEAFPLDLEPGPSRHRILVPDLDAPAEIRFVVRTRGAGAALSQQTIRWQPQRKWKVFVVRSSHEDLGYESHIFKKQRDIANFIDLAREQSRHTQKDGPYQYTMESLLFQRNYIEERGEEAWREVVNGDVKPGLIHLMGAPSGVHSHWMDYEELARMAYPARRETLDRFGLDLKTFMIVDNPSLSWSGAQALANAGFRYVARWGQEWRTGGNNDYARTKLPALFWWKTPDGSRVLFAWRSHYSRSFWYGQTGGAYGSLVDLGSENVNQLLRRVEAGGTLGPYPYDALVNPEYIDHDIPRVDASALPAWSRRYTYPVIKIASPTEFFEYVESKYGGGLPELSGDLNNFSADYAAIDPESQGWKRRAARLLPLAEGFAAIASVLDAGFQPVTAEAARIWTRIFDYDEHSWPTLPPASDAQLFNAVWVKKAEAERALIATGRLIEGAWNALAAKIPAGDGHRVAVFNPLAHERDGVVAVKGHFTALRDAVTGGTVPAQKIEGGQTVFLARRVPAFGYKIYHEAGPAAPPSASLTAEADRIANQFYEVRFHRETGVIRSIRDRKSGRELVDAQAKYGFNQMVYVHKNHRESLDGFEHVAGPARKCESRKGAVRAEFDAWIDDEKTGAAIRQTVILYDGVPRIDIVNGLRHVRALFSDRYEDRYRDNIFYAFPLNVPGGQPRAEYPGGVVRPYLDQLRWGSHDYLFANRWVDVSGGGYGVTLAPWNAATFHFGEIRYNRFSIDYQPSSPHLFSYAYSNRMAGLLTLNADDCNAVLGYSLRAHEGGWPNGETTDFGWSVASPLEAFVLETGAPAAQEARLDARQMSFLAVSAPNVHLTVLKTSEQPGRGWVARFVETQGRETEFLLETRLLPVKRAYACDLVENDAAELPVHGGKVRVKIRGFGFATIRLAGDGGAGVAANVRANALSDHEVKLEWASAPGAASYLVYRSEDPAAPPTAYTLAGRTPGLSFLDSGLKIGAGYTYRVSAVSPGGVEGEVSAPLHVRTRTANTAPPGPVEELGVVRRAKDRLIVYWRKSVEPDVARYYLYRGERAGFDLNASQPLAVLKPGGYFLEVYDDKTVEPGKTYYYKVVAEDWAANRQTHSPVAGAATPAE